jgi:hypothetical protein
MRYQVYIGVGGRHRGGDFLRGQDMMN